MATQQQWHERKWDAALIDAQRYLEYLIMATPTGEVREKLTEVNIMLMQVRELEDARRGARP